MKPVIVETVQRELTRFPTKMFISILKQPVVHMPPISMKRFLTLAPIYVMHLSTMKEEQSPEMVPTELA